jgi:FAD/FMN-containing dehydrogenase
MGLHGLVVDNLLAVELVTAEGEVLDVTESSYPDLFWALRGGGGNFGVAASFEYRLHPLSEVTGGILAYPLDAAGDVLRFYREFTQDTPDALTMHSALVHAPDGSGLKIVGLAICHAGTPEEAERDLAPVRAFREPLVDMLGRISYSAVNSMLDAGYPKGALGYWKSSFLSELSDGLIDATIEHFGETPSAMNAILIEQFHGAATRVPAEATAVANREAGYNLLLPTTWMDPADTEANVAWTRRAYEAFSPWFREGRWLNYLDGDEGEGATHAAYGTNYARLARVKRAHDPDNVFHLNVNITPAA